MTLADASSMPGPKPPKVIDYSKMKMVGKRETYGEEWTETYFNKTTETEDTVKTHFVVVQFSKHWPEKTPSLRIYRRAETQQKFICLGGPHGGKKLSSPGDDYNLFNSATGGIRIDTRSFKRKRVRCVYVYKGLLETR